MLFEIIAGAVMAGAAVQEPTPFSSFDATIPGWSVVRRPDGCFAFTETSGVTFNLFYRANGEGAALLVMLADPRWQPEHQASGYRLQYVGAPGDWQDLGGDGMIDGEGEERTGVISLAFSADAISPMLGDIAAAASLNFFRNTALLASVPLRNGDRAMRRLTDCVQVVAGRQMPGPAAR